MGARPSSFRKAGGFLNGVDGVVKDYQFTDEFNGEPFVAGRDPKTKKEKFHALYFVPSVLVDGADEPVTTTVFVGNADEWEISDDGHVITPVEEGRQIAGGTPFALLLTSLVTAGFPETLFPEEEFDFTAMIGTRVRFVQQKDEKATKDKGQRIDKKTGKAYDRQNLVIETVYELPKGKGGKAAARDAKPAVKSKGKPAPVDDDADEVDIPELAKETLVEILTKAKKPVPTAKLRVLVLTTPLMKGNENRDPVGVWLSKASNLKALAADDVIVFDEDDATVALAA